MKMRQALISIARIAVSHYPRYSKSMPLFSHQNQNRSWHVTGASEAPVTSAVDAGRKKPVFILIAV
jgi:hypothetical protein